MRLSEPDLSPPIELLKLSAGRYLGGVSINGFSMALLRVYGRGGV